MVNSVHGLAYLSAVIAKTEPDELRPALKMYLKTSQNKKFLIETAVLNW
jgi:hypothetical protein